MTEGTDKKAVPAKPENNEVLNEKDKPEGELASKTDHFSEADLSNPTSNRAFLEVKRLQSLTGSAAVESILSGAGFDKPAADATGPKPAQAADQNLPSSDPAAAVKWGPARHEYHEHGEDNAWVDGQGDRENRWPGHHFQDRVEGIGRDLHIWRTGFRDGTEHHVPHTPYSQRLDGLNPDKPLNPDAPKPTSISTRSVPTMAFRVQSLAAMSEAPAAEATTASLLSAADSAPPRPAAQQAALTAAAESPASPPADAGKGRKAAVADALASDRNDKIVTGVKNFLVDYVVKPVENTVVKPVENYVVKPVAHLLNLDSAEPADAKPEAAIAALPPKTLDEALDTVLQNQMVAAHDYGFLNQLPAEEKTKWLNDHADKKEDYQTYQDLKSAGYYGNVDKMNEAQRKIWKDLATPEDKAAYEKYEKAIKSGDYSIFDKIGRAPEGMDAKDPRRAQIENEYKQVYDSMPADQRKGLDRYNDTRKAIELAEKSKDYSGLVGVSGTTPPNATLDLWLKSASPEQREAFAGAVLARQNKESYPVNKDWFDHATQEEKKAIFDSLNKKSDAEQDAWWAKVADPAATKENPWSQAQKDYLKDQVARKNGEKDGPLEARSEKIPPIPEKLSAADRLSAGDYSQVKSDYARTTESERTKLAEQYSQQLTQAERDAFAKLSPADQQLAAYLSEVNAPGANAGERLQKYQMYEVNEKSGYYSYLDKMDAHQTKLWLENATPEQRKAYENYMDEKAAGDYSFVNGDNFEFFRQYSSDADWKNYKVFRNNIESGDFTFLSKLHGDNINNINNYARYSDADFNRYLDFRQREAAGDYSFITKKTPQEQDDWYQNATRKQRQKFDTFKEKMLNGDFSQVENYLAGLKNPEQPNSPLTAYQLQKAREKWIQDNAASTIDGQKFAEKYNAYTSNLNTLKTQIDDYRKMDGMQPAERQEWLKNHPDEQTGYKDWQIKTSVGDYSWVDRMPAADKAALLEKYNQPNSPLKAEATAYKAYEERMAAGDYSHVYMMDKETYHKWKDNASPNELAKYNDYVDRVSAGDFSYVDRYSEDTRKDWQARLDKINPALHANANDGLDEFRTNANLWRTDLDDGRKLYQQRIACGDYSMIDKLSNKNWASFQVNSTPEQWKAYNEYKKAIQSNDYSFVDRLRDKPKDGTGKTPLEAWLGTASAEEKLRYVDYHNNQSGATRIQADKNSKPEDLDKAIKEAKASAEAKPAVPPAPVEHQPEKPVVDRTSSSEGGDLYSSQAKTGTAPETIPPVEPPKPRSNADIYNDFASKLNKTETDAERNALLTSVTTEEKKAIADYLAESKNFSDRYVFKKIMSSIGDTRDMVSANFVKDLQAQSSHLVDLQRAALNDVHRVGGLQSSGAPETAPAKTEQPAQPAGGQPAHHEVPGGGRAQTGGAPATGDEVIVAPAIPPRPGTGLPGSAPLEPANAGASPLQSRPAVPGSGGTLETNIGGSGTGNKFVSNSDVLISNLSHKHETGESTDIVVIKEPVTKKEPAPKGDGGVLPPVTKPSDVTQDPGKRDPNKVDPGIPIKPGAGNQESGSQNPPLPFPSGGSSPVLPRGPLPPGPIIADPSRIADKPSTSVVVVNPSPLVNRTEINPNPPGKGEWGRGWDHERDQNPINSTPNPGTGGIALPPAPVVPSGGGSGRPESGSGRLEPGSGRTEPGSGSIELDKVKVSTGQGSANNQLPLPLPANPHPADSSSGSPPFQISRNTSIEIYPRELARSSQPDGDGRPGQISTYPSGSAGQPSGGLSPGGSDAKPDRTGQLPQNQADKQNPANADGRMPLPLPVPGGSAAGSASIDKHDLPAGGQKLDPSGQLARNTLPGDSGNVVPRPLPLDGLGKVTDPSSPRSLDPSARSLDPSLKPGDPLGRPSAIDALGKTGLDTARVSDGRTTASDPASRLGLPGDHSTMSRAIEAGAAKTPGTADGAQGKPGDPASSRSLDQGPLGKVVDASGRIVGDTVVIRPGQTGIDLSAAKPGSIDPSTGRPSIHTDLNIGGKPGSVLDGNVRIGADPGAKAGDVSISRDGRTVTPDKAGSFVPGEPGKTSPLAPAGPGAISTGGSIIVGRPEGGKADKGGEPTDGSAGKAVSKDPGIGLSQMGQGPTTTPGQKPSTDPVGPTGPTSSVQIQPVNLPTVHISGQDQKGATSGPAADPKSGPAAQDPKSGGPAADPKGGSTTQDPRTTGPSADSKGSAGGHDPRSGAQTTDPKSSTGPDPKSTGQTTDPKGSTGHDPKSPGQTTDPKSGTGPDPKSGGQTTDPKSAGQTTDPKSSGQTADPKSAGGHDPKSSGQTADPKSAGGQDPKSSADPRGGSAGQDPNSSDPRSSSMAQAAAATQDPQNPTSSTDPKTGLSTQDPQTTGTQTTGTPQDPQASIALPDPYIGFTGQGQNATLVAPSDEAPSHHSHSGNDTPVWHDQGSSKPHHESVAEAPTHTSHAPHEYTGSENHHPEPGPKTDTKSPSEASTNPVPDRQESPAELIKPHHYDVQPTPDIPDYHTHSGAHDPLPSQEGHRGDPTENVHHPEPHSEHIPGGENTYKHDPGEGPQSHRIPEPDGVLTHHDGGPIRDSGDHHDTMPPGAQDPGVAHSHKHESETSVPEEKNDGRHGPAQGRDTQPEPGSRRDQGNIDSDGVNPKAESTKHTTLPDGTEITTLPDGSKVTTLPDGVQITTSKDGSFVSEHVPDGSLHHLPTHNSPHDAFDHAPGSFHDGPMTDWHTDTSPGSHPDAQPADGASSTQMADGQNVPGGAVLDANSSTFSTADATGVPSYSESYSLEPQFRQMDPILHQDDTSGANGMPAGPGSGGAADGAIPEQQTGPFNQMGPEGLTAALANDRQIIELLGEMQAQPGEQLQPGQWRADTIDKTDAMPAPSEKPLAPVEEAAAQIAQPLLENIQQQLQINQTGDLLVQETGLLNGIGQELDVVAGQIHHGDSGPLSGNDEVSNAAALVHLGEEVGQVLGIVSDASSAGSADGSVSPLGIVSDVIGLDPLTNPLSATEETILSILDPDLASKYEDEILRQKLENDEDAKERGEQIREEEAKRYAAAMLAALKARQAQEEANRIKAQKDPLNIETRQKYVVMKGDTLESIAQRRLLNKRLSILIYEINKSKIPVTLKEGKRLLQLKPRLVLLLPTQMEVKRFQTRWFGRNFVKFEYDTEFDAAPTKAPDPAAPHATPDTAPDTTPRREKSREEGKAKAPSSEASAPSGKRTSEESRARRRDNIESWLGKLEDTPEDDGRIKYACRLGDSLRSIAMRHPALKDVALWKLLAEINNLSTKTDAKGQPLAELKRGMNIVLPTPAEISEFKAKERHSFANSLRSAEPTGKLCTKCGHVCGLSAPICPACSQTFGASRHSAMPYTTGEEELPAVDASDDVQFISHARIFIGARDYLARGGGRTKSGTDLPDDSTISDTGMPAASTGPAADTSAAGQEMNSSLAGAVQPPDDAPGAKAKPEPSRAVSEGTPTEAAPASTSERTGQRNQIKNLSETCRLVSYGNMDESGDGYRSRLEFRLNDFWLPVVLYEINADGSLMHEYRMNGGRKTRRIDLPTPKARQLAANDLNKHWERYISKFVKNQLL